MRITKDTPLEDIPTPDSVAPLFQPVTVGRFELQTRAVYAPLTRCRAIGAITQPEAATYYSQRTTKGQLIITEATGVSPSTTGYGYPNTPGIHSQEQIEAWKPVINAVHDKGGVFFVQLWNTGRANHPAYLDGEQPVSSSAIAITDGEVNHPTTFEALPYTVPRALETDEVAKYVEYFRSAARNAIDVGFDGVEIHGANGYLIDQFLQDNINKRTDKYGGSIENRCRFALEIVEAITKEIGSDRVGIRLGPFTNFLNSKDSDPYALFGHLIEQLAPFNLAYVHLIEPRIQGNTSKEGEVTDTLVPFIKKCNTKVICAGEYVDRSRTNHGPTAIAEGHTDLVAYGRWALANPDLLKRFKLGAPLNKYDRDTFYVPGTKGYIDYPFLEDTEHASKYFAA